jgi:hypothetical protein
MNTGRAQATSLRPGQLEMTRLAWALAISLAIHLFCFGGYEVGKKLNLWQALHLPAWLQKTKMLAAKVQEQKELKPEEVPLVYVDVSPRQATVEPPKNAKFYSNKNSQAANPDADKDTDLAKIEGKQTQVVKTEDTPRSPYDKLQPVFPAKRDAPPEPPKPKPASSMGDLAMFKPDPNLRPDEGKAEEQRPRTIREALMRQHRDTLVGDKMKQDGGVKHRLDISSLDAKATPFGDYDARFIEIIQSRWYDLLDNQSYDGYRNGKVSLQFRLYYDGRITDMKVLDEDVGLGLSLLCQKAVLDPAPFDKWEREMRLMVDKPYRELKFTFFYN